MNTKAQGRCVVCGVAGMGGPRGSAIAARGHKPTHQGLMLVASFEAECRVATSALLYPTQLDAVMRLCGVADFAFSLPRAVLDAVTSLKSQKREPHLLAVEVWLRSSQVHPSYSLEELCAVTDVVGADIREASATSPALAAMLSARLVADLAEQRQLSAALGQVRSSAGPHTTAPALRRQLWALLADAGRRGSTR